MLAVPSGPVLPPGPAESLVRWLRPRLDLFGITRVADVTGLDHLGIPVAVACRPNGRALSVSQGKGLSKAAAQVGAILESIETWHAETPRLHRRRAAWVEVAGDPRFLDPRLLALPEGSRWRPDLPIPWLPGRELGTGRPLLVPAELVELDTTRLPDLGEGCFIRTTSGLASGASPAGATLHALLELIERDALTLWQLRDPFTKAATRLDLGRVRMPALQALLGSLRAAGILVAAWDVTSDLGVPACLCHIMPARPGPHDGAGWEFGSACHPDPEQALLAAVLEAVQARLTQITGARDDIGRERYAEIPQARLARHRALLRRAGGRLMPEPPWAVQGSPLDHVEAIRNRLEAAGLGPVALVDLSIREIGIPVVRLVVPGLEDGVDLPGWRPGRRARAVAGIAGAHL